MNIFHTTLIQLLISKQMNRFYEFFTNFNISAQYSNHQLTCFKHFFIILLFIQEQQKIKSLQSHVQHKSNMLLSQKSASNQVLFEKQAIFKQSEQCTLPLCSKCQSVHLKQHQKNSFEPQILSLEAAKQRAQKQLIHFISKQQQIKTELIANIKNCKDKMLNLLEELFSQELDKVQKQFESLTNKKEQLKKISKGSLKNLIFYYGDQLPIYPSKHTTQNLLKEFETKVKKQYPQRQLKKTNTNFSHHMPQFLKSYKKSQDITSSNQIDGQRLNAQIKTLTNKHITQYIILSDRKKSASPRSKHVQNKNQVNGSIFILNHKKKDSLGQRYKNAQQIQHQNGHKHSNISSLVYNPQYDKCPSFLLKHDHVIDDRDKSKSSNEIKFKSNIQSKIIYPQQRASSSAKIKIQAIHFPPQKHYQRSPYKCGQKNNNLKTSQLDTKMKIQPRISHQIAQSYKLNSLVQSAKNQKIQSIRTFYFQKQQGRPNSRSQPKKQSLQNILIKKYRNQTFGASNNHTQQNKSSNIQNQQMRLKKVTQSIQLVQLQQKLSSNISKLNYTTSEAILQNRQKLSLAQKYKNIKQKYTKNNSIEKQTPKNERNISEKKVLNYFKREQKGHQGVQCNRYQENYERNLIINQIHSPIKLQSK